MKSQLHKRLPQDFVEEILEAFNSHRLSEEEACELLGLTRARLYRLRQRWLECHVGNKSFSLYGRQNGCFHQLPEEEQRWSSGVRLYPTSGQRWAECSRLSNLIFSPYVYF